MSLLGSLLSSQSPLLLLFVFIVPSLPRLYARLRTRQTRPRPTIQRNTLRLSLLLGFNTFIHLIRIFRPPYNVFHTHHLPITVDVPTLRRYLTHHYRSALVSAQSAAPAGTVLPASSHSGSAQAQAQAHELERLITKLSNLDFRLLYARFGHAALARCGWCTSCNDYALASLPRMLPPYVWCAVIVGVLGWASVSGAHAPAIAARWRGATGWALAVMAAVEVGVRYLSDVRVVEGNCTQYHTIRTLLLALLPIIYTFLPPPSAPDTPTLLASLIPDIAKTSTVLRLSALARTAISSDRALRDMHAAGQRRAIAGRQAARADPHVALAAQQVGLGEGSQGRAQAGQWVRERWAELVRVTAPPESGETVAKPV